MKNIIFAIAMVSTVISTSVVFAQECSRDQDQNTSEVCVVHEADGIVTCH